MNADKNMILVAKEIIEILAKNNCTVAEANQILRATRFELDKATVQNPIVPKPKEDGLIADDCIVAHDSRIRKEDRTTCLSCGREISIKWNYCPKCGNPNQNIAAC